MIHILILAVEISGLGVVLWFSSCGLNHMGRATRPLMILAVALVFAGAGSRLFLLILGEVAADPLAAMNIAGFALAMIVNRRRESKCPCLPQFVTVGARHARHDKEHPA